MAQPLAGQRLRKASLPQPLVDEVAPEGDPVEVGRKTVRTPLHRLERDADKRDAAFARGVLHLAHRHERDRRVEVDVPRQQVDDLRVPRVGVEHHQQGVARLGVQAGELGVVEDDLTDHRVRNRLRRGLSGTDRDPRQRADVRGAPRIENLVEHVRQIVVGAVELDLPARRGSSTRRATCGRALG